MPVGIGKLQPLNPHPLSQEGLLPHRLGGHLESLVAGPLDGSDTDTLQLWDPHPQLNGCQHWSLLHLGFHDLQGGLCQLGWMTTALHTIGNEVGWVGPCKGLNPHQGHLGHPQMLHDSPLGHLGPPELDGSPPGPSIKVFVDCRHCEKALVQNTKTTFFKGTVQRDLRKVKSGINR